MSYEAMNVVPDEMTHTANDGTVTTTNFEEDATDRTAPPKIPASNVSLRLGFLLSIMK